MYIIIATLAGILAGAGGGYAAANRFGKAKFKLYEEQARAKAKAIEFEAQSVLQGAKNQVSEAEDEARRKYDDKKSRLNKEHADKMAEVNAKNEALKGEIKQFNEQKEAAKKEVLAEINRANATLQEAQSLKDAASSESQEAQLKIKLYDEKLNEAIAILERCAGLTQSEAKEEILKKVEEQSRADIAHIVRRYEEEARSEGKKRANYILAQATSRYAGEFAAERLINVVDIKNDDLKGRIIGKEGRNIKTLEMVLGVDIIIDDTPHAVVLSSFNLYRRAIATRVIELLVEDGRIHPARIEEIHQKVCEEFDQSTKEEGEEVVMDLGIGPVHPEIIKLIGKMRFRASYGQNALAHSLEVAHLAGIIAAETGGDEKLAKRAGLLHDIGKALTHEYEGSHVDLGGELCKRYKEHPIVINAIYAHHGHEEVKSVECAAVCAADALSSARPGARREVLEAFLKRVESIEGIATSKNGVKSAYAINAGREIRVIANAKLINDDEAVLIAKEIASEIKDQVQFPGEIKVSVIRETRAVEVAK